MARTENVRQLANFIWDESKTRIGYEIPFTRHFYEYVPQRPLAEIEREIKALEDEIRGRLEEEVSGVASDD